MSERHPGSAAAWFGGLGGYARCMAAVGGDALTVWVFQTGEVIPWAGDSGRPMRAANVTRALLAAGHRVVLWTADFSHQHRTHAYGRHTRLRVSDKLEVRFVHSRGYSRNVGPGRLFDHGQLGLAMRRLLAEERPPDVAVVGYPPIEPAATLTRWLRERDVPVLLDVKDTWPDVLLRAVPDSARPLGRALLDPYYRLSRRAISDATGLSSMSDAFLEWALGVAGRARSDTDGVYPLTAPRANLSDAELSAAGGWWDERGVPADGRPRVVYIGALGTHFTPDTVAQAAAELPAHQFVIGGSGSREGAIAAQLAGLPNTLMPGWLDHARGEVLLRRATVVLAPYIDEPDFQASIPNKFLDAFAHGLPIVTSISGDVGRLVTDEDVGIHYGPAGPSLTQALVDLQTDAVGWQRRAANARSLYDSRFSYDIVYGALVRHLERLARGDGRGEADRG